MDKLKNFLGADMSSPTGRLNFKKSIREKNTSQSFEFIEEYLKSNCESIENVEQGWLVKSKTKRYYYVTPYKLWRPKGKRGKEWYYYRTVEQLVEKYLNKIWETKDENNTTNLSQLTN